MNVLIVENKLDVAKDIISYIKSIVGNIDIAGITLSYSECVEFFERDNPEMIMVDIEIFNFRFYELFAQSDNLILLTFVPNYDSIDNILKFKILSYMFKGNRNFEPKFLIEQAIRFNNGEPLAIDEQNENVRSQEIKKFKKSLLVPVAKGYVLIRTDEIELFIIENHETIMITHGNQKFKIPLTLTSLENRLTPSVFVRINRRCIVNVSSIKGINFDEEGRYFATFRNEMISDVLIARDRIPYVKDAFCQ